MMTGTALVAIIVSCGWLFLNWRSFREGARQQGWSTNRQLQLAAIWVLIIALLTLVFSYFSP